MEQKRYYLQTNSKDAGLAFSTMICLYVFISFLGQAIVGSIFERGTIGYTAICALFPTIAIGVVILYYWLYKNFSLKQLTGIKKTNPLWIILSVVLLCAMFFGFGFINGIVQTLIELAGLKTPSSKISITTISEVVIYTITLAVFPAVFEEIFFRGLMLNALSNAKKVCSITLVSICFALYHGSITQFFYQFLFGVGLCLLAIMSKSVIACICAHFLNNFLIILLEFFNVNINLNSALIIIMGLVFCGAFIFVTIKALSKQESVMTEKGHAKKFFLPFGVVGVLICALLILSNLLVA